MNKPDPSPSEGGDGAWVPDKHEPQHTFLERHT